MIERVLALALLAASGVYVANAWMLPLGTTARPGAGSYPLAVGLFGAAVALAWVVAALRRAPAGAPGARAPETLAFSARLTLEHLMRAASPPVGRSDIANIIVG